MCIYTYTYVYIYIQLYIYIHTYIYVCVCVYICIYTYICVYIHIYMLHTYLNLYIHYYSYIYTCHTYKYLWTRITHAPTSKLLLLWDIHVYVKEPYLRLYVYVMNRLYTQIGPHARTHARTYTHTNTHTQVGGEREGAQESCVCVWHTVWLCVEILKRKKRKIEDFRRIFREPQTYILFYVWTYAYVGLFHLWIYACTAHLRLHVCVYRALLRMHIGIVYVSSYARPKMEKLHSSWLPTVWWVENMFEFFWIMSNNTICYSILYCNSPIGLKYTYSVISEKLDWLPGNSKKWTID